MHILAVKVCNKSSHRLSQHPQLPSLITPWANTTAPQDTSRKGCASPCASRSIIVRPSCKESWRNGCGLCMAYVSHKPPSASPWNALMSYWQWWRTPVSRPYLHSYPSGCAVPANGACTQTLVPWAAWQGQPERRYATREGGTLPARASSWCSRDGVLTRLVGEVQRPARDQVISPFWGKRGARHGNSWRGVTEHPRCCWCICKERRVQHGWN